MQNEHLVVFNANNLDEGEPGGFPAERIVEGDPKTLTWSVEETADGKILAGVWEVTPGTFINARGNDWEYCYIISGQLEITEEGKAPVLINAGDSFIMRPGYKGKWRIIETVRKYYVIVNPAA